MTEFKTVYRFQDDKEAIKRLQKVSRDPKSDYGLKIENGLLVGTREWFNAVESGQFETMTIIGQISKVYMSGHNDYPEFEIDINGEKSTWTREGLDELYIVGKRIELTYVLQKFKRPWSTGSTTKIVLEIKIGN